MLALRVAGALLAVAAVAQAAVYPRAGVCGGTDRGYIDAGTTCKPCGVNNRANGSGGNGCSPCYVGGQLLASTPYPAGVPFAADPAYPGGTGCFCNSDKGLFADKCKMCVGLGRLNGAFPSNACGRCITSSTDPKYIDPVDGSCKSIASPCANPVTQQGNTIGLSPSPSSAAFFVEFPQGKTATACCQKCYSTAGCVGWVKPLTGDTEFGAAYAGGYCLLGMNTSPSLFSGKECGLEGSRIVTPSASSPARYEVQAGPCGRIGAPATPPTPPTPPTPSCSIEGQTYSSETSSCQCPAGQAVYGSVCAQCPSEAQPVGSGSSATCRCSSTQFFVPATATAPGSCSPCSVADSSTVNRLAGDGTTCGAACPAGSTVVTIGGVETCKCPTTKEFFTPGQEGATGICSPCSNTLDGNGTTCGASCGSNPSLVVPTAAGDACTCVNKQQSYSDATGTCTACPTNSLNGDGRTCGTQCATSSFLALPNADKTICVCPAKNQAYNPTTKRCSVCPNNSYGDGVICTTSCGPDAAVARPVQVSGGGGAYTCGCINRQTLYDAATQTCSPCPANTLNGNYLTCGASCGPDPTVAAPNLSKSACVCVAPNASLNADFTCTACPAEATTGDGIVCGAPCPISASLVSYGSTAAPTKTCSCNNAQHNFTPGANNAAGSCALGTAYGNGGLDQGLYGWSSNGVGNYGNTYAAPAAAAPFVTGMGYQCTPGNSAATCYLCPVTTIDTYHQKVPFTMTYTLGFYGSSGLASPFAPPPANRVLRYNYSFSTQAASGGPVTAQSFEGSSAVSTGVGGQVSVVYNIPAGTLYAGICFTIPAQTYIDNFTSTYS